MVKIDKRVIVISIIIIVVIEFCAILKLDHFFYDSWHWLALSESIYEGKGYCFNPDYFHDKYLSDRPLLKGECPTRMRQPGFALFLVLAYWLPGQNLLFFKIVQAVLSLFSFLFAILIARKIFVNSSSLNIFVVLMALYFPLWILVTYIMSETLFTFLLVAAMYLFVLGLTNNKNSRWHWAAAGVIFAFAMLVRPIILPVVVLSIIPCIVYLGPNNGLKKWSLFVLFFVIACSPWAIRNGLATGAFTPLCNEGGYTIWANTSPINLQPEEYLQATAVNEFQLSKKADSRFYRMSVRHILENPALYSVNCFIRLARLWLNFPVAGIFFQGNKFIGYVIQGIIIVLFLLGLLRFSPKDLSFLLLPIVITSIMSMAMQSEARYTMPVMPFFLIIASQGAAVLLNEIIKKRNHRESIPAQIGGNA